MNVAGTSTRLAPEREPSFTRFDFRRTTPFNRDAVAALEAAHEVFARRTASGWGNTLRTLAQLEAVGVDQISYDEYVRSLPNPSVLVLVRTPRLAGPVIVELSVQFALLLVDRLLGGRPGVTRAALPPTRRPTELETRLLTSLLSPVVAALDETLAPVGGEELEVAAIEYNPNLLQVAAPPDPMLLLSFRAVLSQGINAEGLVTVAYPEATAASVLEAFGRRPGAGDEDGEEGPGLVALRAMSDRVQDASVVLEVCLTDSPISARDVSSLEVGDVLRLDHAIDEPVGGRVAGREVIAAHVGRRGRRLAIQVIGGLEKLAALSHASDVS